MMLVMAPAHEAADERTAADKDATPKEVVVIRPSPWRLS